MIQKFLTMCLLVGAGSISVLGAGADAAAAGNSAGGSLGFSGGAKVTLGAEFEHEMERNFGMGAYLKIVQKDKDTNSVGFFTVGANARVHFPQKRWDFSAAPGFGLINIDSPFAKPDDTTTFGPSMLLTVLYQINNRVSLGMEHASYFVWFDDEWSARSPHIDMSAKLMASF